MSKIVIDEVIGWWPATAFAVRRRLEEAGGAPVDVEIDSPGGSVIEGIAIFNLLRDYAGEVTVTVSALAASMATYIALAGDRLRVRDNSTWMIHNVWSVIAGDHNELRKQADIQESLTELLARRYAAKTGKSLEDVRGLMDAETWLFGPEIVEAGFADEVLDAPDGEAASRETANALAHERFSEMEARMREGSEPIQAVAAALGSCGVLGCGDEGRAGWVAGIFGGRRPEGPANDGSMKESENGPNPQQGETMEISTLTAQALREGNAALYDAIRAEGYEEGLRAGAEKEAERLAALEAVDSLGLEAATFAALLEEHKADATKSATDLIVAVAGALAAQRKAEEEKRQTLAKRRAEDGVNLARQMAELEPGTGVDDGEAASAAERAAMRMREARKKIDQKGVNHG